MKFPWNKPETRAVDYTDTLVALLVERATGNTTAADAQATAAFESAVGTVGRGFAACEVTADSPSVQAALSPDMMELFGRSLVRGGELVCYIDTTGGVVNLLPAQSHNVYGGPMPSSWRYDVTLSGPSVTQSYYNISAQSVVHLRYAAHRTTPWRGQSPIEVASLSGKLSAETIKALGDEASGPVGRILGLPTDGDDPGITQFKRDLANAKGGIATIENGDWGKIDGSYASMKTERFGAEPSRPLVDLAKQASNEIYSAIGFNPALFVSGDSASLREAWRLALFACLWPLGRKVAAELSLKLGMVELSWSELRASDLQNRARAFGSLVTGGLTVAAAAAEAGLEHRDEAPKPAMAESPTP